VAADGARVAAGTESGKILVYEDEGLWSYGVHSPARVVDAIELDLSFWWATA
jgi:hypothetical protein